MHRLCAQLEAEGVRSKRWVTAKGRVLGDRPLTRGALFYLLRNRTYLGEIVHRDIAHPGLHPGLVELKLFEAVQRRLTTNAVVRRKRADRPADALLTGLIFDGDGRPFSPTFSSGRSGRIHRYYVAADLQQGREPPGREDTIRRVGADALERLVLSELRRLSGRSELDGADIRALLRRLELRPSDTQSVLDAEGLFGFDHPELALEDLRSRLGAGERLVQEPGPRAGLRIVLPRRMQLRGGRTWILVDGDQANRPRVDLALADALRKGHSLLAETSNAAPTQRYARRLVQLALIAPDLQRKILEGRQPREMTLARVLRSEFPLSWLQQRSWWNGFA